MGFKVMNKKLKVFMWIGITFIVMMLAVDVYVFKDYNTRVVGEIVEVREQDTTVGAGRYRTTYHYMYTYQYTYNDKIYQYTTTGDFPLEMGYKRYLLLKDDNPQKCIFETSKLTWSNVVYPFASEKDRAGEYTYTALELQDKYDYDFELNQ